MRRHTFKFPEKYLLHGALFYDTKKEEGYVSNLLRLPKNVVGLDILQDWIVDLQDTYDKLHKEVFPKENQNADTK